MCTVEYVAVALPPPTPMTCCTTRTTTVREVECGEHLSSMSKRSVESFKQLNPTQASCSELTASNYRLQYVFLFQAEDGIRDSSVTGVQTCAFFFSSRRRHTRFKCDWSSDVCSSD